jgi:SAM-dependent methyltransferase
MSAHREGPVQDQVGRGSDHLETYFTANRLNWDNRTEVHLASSFYDVEGWLADRRGPDRREASLLGDVSDLRLVHLQCHFGLDTLGWARAGANVVGLDFSPAAVDAARDIAGRAALADKAEFVCANVLDAVQALGGRVFDIVYVSLGALCWLPSVEGWAEQVGALLGPGGRLLLHDVHPMAFTFDDSGERSAYSYFEAPVPYVDDLDYTYTGTADHLQHRRNYQWNHSFGELFTALNERELRMSHFEEHDWAPFRQFPWMIEGPRGWTSPPDRPRLPLSYTLLATKPDLGQ